MVLSVSSKVTRRQIARWWGLEGEILNNVVFGNSYGSRFNISPSIVPLSSHKYPVNSLLAGHGVEFKMMIDCLSISGIWPYVAH